MEQNRTIILDGYEINYILTRKKVKNVNLRINADGVIKVSANNRVSIAFIENFIKSNTEFILKHLERIRNAEKPKSFDDNKENREKAWGIFTKIIDEIYPIFKEMNVQYPVLKIRTMKSKWGSCIPSKNQITLNTRLIEHNRVFIEYVILHEFCHFIHPNHSKDFYNLVEKLMPDWKYRQNLLKSKNIGTL
ncbi:MAG: SprT family zinc-dependent metalloprotease [Clostridia bacterium]